MNRTDRDYFDVKLTHLDRKLQVIHDDVLIMKTERKAEKKIIAVIAAASAFAITSLVNILWR